MNKGKRITIKFVAKEAGVSTQTVSRVLNNEPHVAPETKEKVLEIIKRLDYRPSQLARSLIQGRSHTIGVMGFGMKFYGPSRTFMGIEQEAVNLGYNLFLRLVRYPEDYNVEDAVGDMLAYHVEGIIWALPLVGDNRDWIVNAIPKLPVPVVFLNMDPHKDLSVVAVNNLLGGEMATRHLVENGYKTIGIITGPIRWWEARMRLQGWKNVLSEAGLEIADDLIIEGKWNSASGDVAMRQLLSQRPDIDAAFVSNDQMAFGAMKAAITLGRKIPHELGLIGFDDIPETPYFMPSLSTIKQDLGVLGSQAVKELYRMILEARSDSPVSCKTILLEPRLLARDSSDRPR